MAKSTLAKMPTAEIEKELKRRLKGVRSLQRKRDRLADRLREMDRELASMGGSVGSIGGVRRRARNDSNLVDALARVLDGKTMGVTEVSLAVQEAGYATTSPNFRTIVNQALIKDKRFKRVGRGKYTVKS